MGRNQPQEAQHSGPDQQWVDTATPGPLKPCSQGFWELPLTTRGLALAPGSAPQISGQVSAPGPPGPGHQQANSSSETPWAPQPASPGSGLTHQWANTSSRTPRGLQQEIPGPRFTHHEPELATGPLGPQQLRFQLWDTWALQPETQNPDWTASGLALAQRPIAVWAPAPGSPGP